MSRKFALVRADLFHAVELVTISNCFTTAPENLIYNNHFFQ